jgi:hypothetical protein
VTVHFQHLPLFKRRILGLLSGTKFVHGLVVFEGSCDLCHLIRQIDLIGEVAEDHGDSAAALDLEI